MAIDSIQDMFRVARAVARDWYPGNSEDDRKSRAWAVVDACYWWAGDHHRGMFSWEYESQCRLSRFFTPSSLATGPEDEAAADVYDYLCEANECEHPEFPSAVQALEREQG